MKQITKFALGLVAIMLGACASNAYSSNEVAAKGIPASNSTTPTVAAYAFIEKHENYEPRAYNDPVGYCTIGFGHLIAKAKCEDIELPSEFANGITRAKARSLMKIKIDEKTERMNALIETELNSNQYDALVSFVYNLGPSAFADSTMLRKINSGDLETLDVEFRKYVLAGRPKRKLRGLVTRREDEIKMFYRTSAAGSSKGVTIVGPEPSNLHPSDSELLSIEDGLPVGK